MHGVRQGSPLCPKYDFDTHFLHFARTANDNAPFYQQ